MDFEQKIEEGKQLQKKAQQAFNNLNFDEAFHYYEEAEKAYRLSGTSLMTDRIFFMQCSALRCLEEMLEFQTNLHSIYSIKVKNFLHEWTNQDISKLLSRDRVSEALAFRQWRETSANSIASDVFLEANRAMMSGDFDTSNVLLDAFIAEQHDSINPERDALIAIARSKQELLIARKEANKRKLDRDLNVLVQAWLRSARVSFLPSNTESQQKYKIASYRAFALSKARKYKANMYLLEKDKNIIAVKKSFTNAENCLAKAVKYAGISAELRLDDPVPEKYERLVIYTHQTVLERLSLFRFMETGEEHYFQSAVDAWRNAVTNAESLYFKDGIDIFPNRFNCVEDLKLEKLFLDAAKAFRNQDWAKCTVILQRWIDEFPDSHTWSWRYSNVLIRLKCVELINAIDAPDNTSLKINKEKLRELDGLARSEMLGKAAYHFIKTTKILPGNLSLGLDVSSEFEGLSRCFPLDSTVDSSYDLVATDPFKTLPKNIGRGFLLSVVTNRAQLELKKLEFLSSVEALLGLMYDYDSQWSQEPVLLKPDIHKFFSGIRKFGWVKKRYRNTVILNQFETLITEIKKTTACDSFNDFHKKARYAVRYLLKFMPLVVELEAPIKDVREQGHDAVPDWSMDNPDKDTIRIAVKSKKALPVEAGLYFLEPPWRKGNRPYYLFDPDLDQHKPLFPVRFEPRWEFWEDEILHTTFSEVNASPASRDQFLEIFPDLKIYSPTHDQAKNTYEETMMVLKEFQHKVETKFYKTFFKPGTTEVIRHEEHLHTLFHSSWCGHRISKIQPEADTGLGKVDFLISRSQDDQCVLEFKLASSSRLIPNLNFQSETYQNGTNALYRIDVVLYFTDAEKEKVIKIKKELPQERTILLIDGRPKVTGSKKRTTTVALLD